jgi:hypothetical protein
MTNRLQELLDEARKNVPTPQEKEEQRRSFAYGEHQDREFTHYGRDGRPGSGITEERVGRFLAPLGMTNHGGRARGNPPFAPFERRIRGPIPFFCFPSIVL